MPNPFLTKLLAKISPADVGVGMRKSSIDALERLQERGVISPKITAAPMEGPGMSATRSTATINIGNEPLRGSPDYHTYRMGADPSGPDRGAALHETFHLAPKDYWDPMAEMRAVRGMNMMRNSPAWASYNEDLRKIGTGEWNRIGEAKGIPRGKVDMEAAFDKPIGAAWDHDTESREILADSGARLGKAYDDSLDSRQPLLGDKTFKHELAVTSTLMDRFNTARALVEDFMGRNRAKHLPMQEGAVPPKQGRLF